MGGRGTQTTRRCGFVEGYLVRVLTRTALASRMKELVALDGEAFGDGWREVEFFVDLPGKWELSWFVLDDRGHVAGFLVASLKPAGIHVHRLVVARALRSRGLGRELLNVVAEEAVVRGISTVTLKVAHSNEGARRFYGNLGFEESGCDAKNTVLSIAASALRGMGPTR